MMIIKETTVYLMHRGCLHSFIYIGVAPSFKWAGCTARHKNRETRAKGRALGWKMLREMRFKQGNAGR